MHLNWISSYPQYRFHIYFTMKCQNLIFTNIYALMNSGDRSELVMTLPSWAQKCPVSERLRVFAYCMLINANPILETPPPLLLRYRNLLPSEMSQLNISCMLYLKFRANHIYYFWGQHSFLYTQTKRNDKWGIILKMSE